MGSDVWRIERGSGPIVATAIHDGHAVRDEVGRLLALSEPERLREEDPHTASWTDLTRTRVIVRRSRFEVDMNRQRDRAVYLTPDDAWGLDVWSRPLPEEVVERSLAQYDAFYAALHELYEDKADTYGAFVVYDLHSYNHRRAGPEGPEADPRGNPQVNVGTGTMGDRELWAPLVARFIDDLSSYEFPGGPLDVRENVRFTGGHCAWQTHDKFQDSGCVLSIEVKKFFMDEWTGRVDTTLLAAVGDALASTVPGVLDELSDL